MSNQIAENKNALVIERVFNVPIERVWKAWSDEETIKKWWGPKNFTAPIIKIDENKTKLTLTHIGHPAGVMGDMAKQGWNQSLDKLAESLK